MGVRERAGTGSGGAYGQGGRTRAGDRAGRSLRRVFCLLMAVMLAVTLPAGAWSVPGAGGDCTERFGDAASWYETEKQCQFAAQLEPDTVFVGGEKELGTGYYTHPHVYQIENAIRLFREKGYDNWALYLSGPDRFQALADGATWADAYKGRLVVHISFNVLWTEVYGYDIDICNHAGFDQYYNSYNADPAGKGLDSAGLDILADALPALIQTLGPAIVELAGAIAGVPGLGGLLTSLSVEIRPPLQSEYPSGAFQAQQHYDRSVAYYYGGMDPSGTVTKLYFPQRSQEYNSLFELGWALHLIQDIGVIYHTRDILSSFPPNPHNDFEDDAQGHGNPLDGESADYHVTGSGWTLGLDYADKKITELARDEADAVSDEGDWAMARSDDAEVRRPMVQKGARISEQYTAAVLAKYLEATGIPKVKQPFQGRVEDMHNNPVPYAFVFWRKGLQCVQHPDKPTVCGTPPGAWNFVRADKNGVYVLDLKPSDASTIDTYLVRPVMPGYRYAGYQAGGSNEILGAILDGKPLEYKPPWKSEAVTSNPFYELYLAPTGETGPAPQVAVLSPVLLTLSPGALPSSTTDSLRRDLLSVNPESPVLRVSTNNAFQQQMLSLPETSYVEVELANLADLNAPRVLDRPDTIRSTVLSARDRRAAVMAAQKNAGAGAVPPTISIAGTAAGSVPSGLFTGSSTPEGWRAALALMPRTRVEGPGGTPLEVPDLSGAFGTAPALSGDFLPANGMVRVPARNARIEVTLEPGPGAIGPGFTDVYAGTAQAVLPGIPGAGGAAGTQAIAGGASLAGSSGTVAGSGDPVPGLITNPGVQQPGAVKKSLVLTTGSNGKAALMLGTGNQAGRIRLHFRVIANPDAPGVLPEDTVEFMVHPLVSEPDTASEVLPVIQEVSPREEVPPAPAAGPVKDPVLCFTVGPDRAATAIACPDRPLAVRITDTVSAVSAAAGKLPAAVWPAPAAMAATTGRPSCDDGNACTVMDRVVRGTCTGDAVLCTDGGRCDPAAGCVDRPGPAAGATLPVTARTVLTIRTPAQPADGSACDDGNACTAGDLFRNGACRGEPFVCSDGDDMTADSCDPRTGCVFTRLGQVAETTAAPLPPVTAITQAPVHVPVTAATAPELCPAGCTCLTRDEAVARFGRYLPCSDTPCGSPGSASGQVLRYCLRPAA